MGRGHTAGGGGPLERRRLLGPNGERPVHPSPDDPVSLARRGRPDGRVGKVREAVFAHALRELDVERPDARRGLGRAADRAWLQLGADPLRGLV
jgi:hypothetical protein